ncbi:hypothetical protein Pcinc_024996 [Petrolisthes cinctipes]|uniref:Uncharacterized protein n=1 Tax=Petrolisthes cinctipes TaxID=88211 RepID=A0AAE1FBG9_PETCI|nr:hypothetical protein Pcinc_024996 [Petrolisthes cinctipes]
MVMTAFVMVMVAASEWKNDNITHYTSLPSKGLILEQPKYAGSAHFNISPYCQTPHQHTQPVNISAVTTSGFFTTAVINTSILYGATPSATATTTTTVTLATPTLTLATTTTRTTTVWTTCSQTRTLCYTRYDTVTPPVTTTLYTTCSQPLAPQKWQEW